MLLALAGCEKTRDVLESRTPLIRETRVNPGETYVVPGYGEAGSTNQATLVCQYRDKRGDRWRVFWYSASNSMGKDRCPASVGEND